MKRVDRIAGLLVAENDEYAQQAMKCVSVLMPAVARAYKQMFGEESPRATMSVRVGITDSDLPEGKVGAFELSEGEREHGVLLVRPGTFSGERAPYWYVIAHELIHAFLGKSSEYHNKVFNAMADAIGIPEQYRK